MSYPNEVVISVIQINDQVMTPHTYQHEHIDTLELIGVAESNNIVEVVQLGRSQRTPKPSISSDFVVYLQEH